MWHKFIINSFALAIVLFPSCALTYKQGMSKDEFGNDVGVIISSKILSSVYVTFVSNDSGYYIVKEYAITLNNKVISHIELMENSSYSYNPPIELCLSSKAFSQLLYSDRNLRLVMEQINPDFLIINNHERRRSFDIYYRHEYGHTIQSKRWGPLYLPGPALFSLRSAIVNTSEAHNKYWTETSANSLSNYYYHHYFPSNLY